AWTSSPCCPWWHERTLSRLALSRLFAAASHWLLGCPLLRAMTASGLPTRIEMTRRHASGRDLDQSRAFGPAARQRERATRMEVATRWRRERRRDFARDRGEAALAGVEPRHIGQQRLRIGVVWRAEPFFGRSAFDHA